MLSRFNLLAGRLLEAWRAYPEARAELRSMPAGPPIFVTGTHRSGTTWFARMLAVPGVWYVHEPFAPAKGAWPEEFTYVRRDICNTSVDALMLRVLSGGFRKALNLANADHPLMPLRLFPQPFRRILIKDPIACLLTAYLTRRFDLRTIILFRHPAGFVSSVCRLGWPRAKFIRRLLDSRELMEDHLQPYVSLLEAHASVDDVTSAAVLYGALNTVLWRFVEAGVGRHLLFEDLCADPIGQLELVFGQLGLPYSDKVRALHESLCFGKAQPINEYHPHSVARNSQAMAESWKQQLTLNEIGLVREVWEQFDVPLYRSDAEWIPERSRVAAEVPFDVAQCVSPGRGERE